MGKLGFWKGTFVRFWRSCRAGLGKKMFGFWKAKLGLSCEGGGWGGGWPPPVPSPPPPGRKRGRWFPYIASGKSGEGFRN